MASNYPITEPMDTAEFLSTEEFIEKNQSFLKDNLRRTDRIVALLGMTGILSPGEGFGSRCAGRYDGNEKLIKCVLEKHAAAPFVRALKDSDQGALVDYLVTNKEVESQITVERVQRHKGSLKDQLEPDYGILDELLKRNILTYQNYQTITSVNGRPPFARSEEIINFVLEKHAISGLIACLRESDQRHVVNYLIGNGAHMTDLFGNLWPLTDDQLQLLNVNQGRLVECIDPCDLLERLLSRDVINIRQNQKISVAGCNADKNVLLLDILRRRSIEDFQEAIDCLEKSNQKHIADVLQKGGVVLRAQFTLHGETANVNATEDEISTNYARGLAGRSLEEQQRILQLTEFKLLNLKRGNSIHLYIYCETLGELMAVRDLFITGSIKTIAEDLFSRLVSHRGRVVVSDYSYLSEEYEKLKSFLEAKEQRGSRHASAAKMKAKELRESSQTSEEKRKEQRTALSRLKSMQTFKVIVIGESNVGKTNLTSRFCGGTFSDKFLPSIGFDFRQRTLKVKDEEISVQLWDTAGQERFHRSMVHHYYRNAHAVVFVYDVTEIASFESLPRWVEECDRYDLGSNVPRILVGNKTDLKEKRAVAPGTAREFAKRHDMFFYETSAKDDNESVEIEKIFVNLAYTMYYHPIRRDAIQRSDVVRVTKAPESKPQSSGCYCW